MEGFYMDDYTDEAATFGDRLAVARERQGMGQSQLAKRLGLKLSTIENWEADRSEPRANKIQMLAGFLNVSIVWLMTGQGEGGPTGYATLEGPDGMAALIAELQDIRLQQMRLADRAARVEKRLRELHQG
ncbi:MAG: helix-turn-helix transcriptional regulator [Pseudomonadota bacterium]